MHNQEFIHNLKEYLQQQIFKSDIVKFDAIGNGGSSDNFLCQTKELSCIVKLLPKYSEERAKRLCRILNTLKQNPDFHTAKLIGANEQNRFVFEERTGLLLTYAAGQKIRDAKLSPDILNFIMSNYRQFQKIKFDDDLILPFVSPEEQHAKIAGHIIKLTENHQNFIKRKILNQMKIHNDLISENLKNIPREGIARTIHGDFSLNNILLDNDKAFLLDFEALRYGYAAEDMMFLVLSTILPHSVVLLPKKQLTTLLLHLKNKEGFTKQELLYGAGRYFQTLLSRRIFYSKFLQSLRKDCLFIYHLRKYPKLIKIINNLS